MDIEKEIFKRSKVNIEKLIKYGFHLENNTYLYVTNFMNNQFKAIITIDNSCVSGKVIDNSFNEEYINFRIKSQTGKFSSLVKEAYETILLDIKKKCFDSYPFIYDQTNRISLLIKEKYSVEPEFLWESTPGAGVFRDLKSKKWFGIIMDIPKNKVVGIDTKTIEVLNVKLDEEVSNYLKVKGIYPAYHMNKKNWVTIILDDTICDEEIIKLVEKSYNYIH